MNVTQSSGKGWLRVLKKVVQVAGGAAGVLLATPLKLPGKVAQIAQFVALLAGIVKATEKTGTDE